MDAVGRAMALLLTSFARSVSGWQSSSTSNSGLVNNLVRDQRIGTRTAEALRAVDRKNFVPADQEHYAYEDRPLPLGHDVTISAPHMHGTAIELLLPNIKDGAVVLDVGVGRCVFDHDHQ